MDEDWFNLLVNDSEKEFIVFFLFGIVFLTLMESIFLLSQDKNHLMM